MGTVEEEEENWGEVGGWGVLLMLGRRGQTQVLKEVVWVEMPIFIEKSTETLKCTVIGFYY